MAHPIKEQSLRSIWRRCRRGAEFRPGVFLLASLALLLVLGGLGIGGGWLRGMFRPSFGPTGRLGDVQDDDIVTGAIIAGIAWIAMLAWLWRPMIRLHRGQGHPHAYATPLFGCVGIGALVVVLSYFFGRRPWDDTQWIVLAVSLVGAGVAVVLWLPTVFLLEGGRPLRGIDGLISVFCPQCGYSLVGLSTTTCPECGAQYTLDKLVAAQGYAAIRSDGGPLLIMVAGPYSAATADERESNLRALNEAAAEIGRRGHTPLVAMNEALAILGSNASYEATIELSLALAERCDGVVRLDRSPGADREVDRIVENGGRVWDRVEDVPQV